MKQFYVSFEGYVMLTAENPEEAMKQFWEHYCSPVEDADTFEYDRLEVEEVWSQQNY